MVQVQWRLCWNAIRFCDIDPITYCINPISMKNISHKTKAIMAVAIGGQSMT